MNGLDMGGARATAAPDDVQEAGFGPFCNFPRHRLGRLIVFTELVGKTCIGMGRDMGVCDLREFFDILAQLFRAQSTVKAKRNRTDMTQGVPESANGLP